MLLATRRASCIGHSIRVTCWRLSFGESARTHKVRATRRPPSPCRPGRPSRRTSTLRRQTASPFSEANNNRDSHHCSLSTENHSALCLSRTLLLFNVVCHPPGLIPSSTPWPCPHRSGSRTFRRTRALGRSRPSRRSPRCPLSGPEAALGHRGSFERSLATSAFVASCAAVVSLNFLISAGLVLPLPIGSAALFIAYAERSAAMAL